MGERGKDWNLLGSVDPYNMDLVREAQVTPMSSLSLYFLVYNWGNGTNNLMESLRILNLRANAHEALNPVRGT